MRDLFEWLFAFAIVAGIAIAVWVTVGIVLNPKATLSGPDPAPVAALVPPGAVERSRTVSDMAVGEAGCVRLGWEMDGRLYVDKHESVDPVWCDYIHIIRREDGLHMHIVGKERILHSNQRLDSPYLDRFPVVGVTVYAKAEVE